MACNNSPFPSSDYNNGGAGGSGGVTASGGSGGSPGSGGATNTGGSGGTTASGGVSGDPGGAGGATSVGGSGGTTSAGGSGGVTSTGGAGGVIATGGAGGSGGATATAPTPLLQYHFDGAATNSGSLSGYTISTFAGTSYGTGKKGQGIKFGSTDYATATGMRGVLGAHGKITVAFWMYQTAALQTQSFWDDNNRCCTAPFGGVQLGQSTADTISVCVASTTAWLGGSCGSFTAPSVGAWHHWIIRYAGTGTGAGQGGAVQIYVDDVLVFTRANDADNNPVFNATGMPDTMTLDGGGVTLDELAIYGDVFSVADQCTFLVGGTWTGTSCTLPQ
ncbi:MAG TPA: hypothetical protein VHJ20_16210 [Polyangia bacterium]|nr:hypothetical protein [Polyangia bacterium]